MTHLPPLPLEEWESTKETLHLWLQIVGKVRLGIAPPQNHWWHSPLYVDTRGLTTRRLRSNDIDFDVSFDLVDHALVVRTSRGDVDFFPLRHGLSVADFYERFMTILAERGSGPRSSPGPTRFGPRPRSRRTPATRAMTVKPSLGSGRRCGGSTGRCRSSPAGFAARRAPCTSSGTASTSPSPASWGGGLPSALKPIG
jgi:hypothetical protein